MWKKLFFQGTLPPPSITFLNALGAAAELRDGYESSAAELRAQLKTRGERVAELLEASAHAAAQLEDLRAELEAVSGGM